MGSMSSPRSSASGERQYSKISWKGSVVIFSAQTSPVVTSRKKNRWMVRKINPPRPMYNQMSPRLLR